MPYGELRFDDEDLILENQCELCGGVDGHEPNCVLGEDYDVSEPDLGE